jgi:carbon storage regulator CsrA
MLVLTRKTAQRIQIGRDISITVLRVKGNTVRIGIDAPVDVRVRRSELLAFDAEQESELLDGSDPSLKQCADNGSSAAKEKGSRIDWSASDHSRGELGESTGSSPSRQSQRGVRSSHDRRSGVILGR